MARFLKNRSATINQPPGSLVFIGNERLESDPTKARIDVTDFDKDRYSELTVENLEGCQAHLEDESSITWIDVRGLTNFSVIASIGKTFGIDPLYLEDVLNTDHRPKAEDLEDHLFIILKSVSLKKSNLNHRVHFEQISLFLSHKMVVSFHEFDSEIFSGVKDRLRKSKGRIRQMDADYLFYALIDAVVDNYFFVVESIGSEIEELDIKLLNAFSKKDLQSLNRLKSEILYLRKSILPIRETIAQILRTERKDLSKKTKIYLGDTLDHVVQISDVVDSYRDLLTGLADVARTAANRELNETMKILTVFTAVFIPLTFISSIYGMNFSYIPELHWKHGYLFFWIIILSVSGGMITYFRKKKWI